jgi:hypothetical protein
MTTKAKTLKDIAVAFYGVTSAGILSDKKLSGKSKVDEDWAPCRIIYPSDIASEGPWRDSDIIKNAKVARRFVERGRRNLDRKHLPAQGIIEKNKTSSERQHVLAEGDILIATRGRYTISPLVSRKILASGPVVAGPDIIVVRTKSPAPEVVRKILLRKGSLDYLSKNTVKKGKDGSSVLTKGVIMSLELPDEIDGLHWTFDERVEDYARDAETTSGRIAALSRAFVTAARYRLEKRHETSRPRFDAGRFSWEEKATRVEHDILTRSGAAHQKIIESRPLNPLEFAIDWSWKEPFDKELAELSENRDKWASEGLIKCLAQIAGGHLEDADAKLLCELLTGGSDHGSVRARLASDSRLLESTTLLLHRGDYRASSSNVGRSIRQLLASCVRGMEDVVVLSAETGHQAVEATLDKDAPSQLLLVEQNETYRNFAKALCEFISPSTQVRASAEIASDLGAQKVDAAILEASGADADIKDDKLDHTSRKLFDWANLCHRLKDGGKMFVHIPSSHWKLLGGISSNISTIVQLPPLLTPSDSEYRPRDEYAPCDQGLILVVEAGWGAGKDVKLIDATMLSGGAAAEAFSAEQLEALRQTITGNSLPSKGIRQIEIPRDTLFRNYKTWPGVSKFFGSRAVARDLANDFTLETIVEELKFCHLAWKASQDAFLESAGIRFRS